MNTTIYHPDLSEMPRGFQFPQEYLDMIALGEDNYDDMGFWSFMCYYEGYISGWIKTLKEEFPDRDLVPFAILSNDDEITCFDNQNPPHIHCINYFAKSGKEQRGYWKEFKTWVRDMVEQADEEYALATAQTTEKEEKEKNGQTGKM